MFWPRRFAGGLGLGVALCAVAAPYAGHARGSTPTALTASDSVGRSGASAVPVATTVRARRVPNEYPTIQAAVDAARPGDLVLIAPGVYREIVTVTTPLLVLRGTDRNATIIDAEFARRDGIVVRADGVAVENLTVQHALGNGVVLDGVTGWRASYLTAIRNGDHGIFARGATDGLVEASHVSGSSVAGIAIEACRPCRTIVRHVTAEYNAAGYRGRDAEGVRVVASLVRRNRAGLMSITTAREARGPTEHTRFTANVIAENGNTAAPVDTGDDALFGNGIVLVGTDAHLIERNLVVGHPLHGILVAPAMGHRYRPARGNIVRDNVVRGSGRADVAVSGPWSSDNCAARNGDGPVAPTLLTFLGGCDHRVLPTGLDLVPAVAMRWRGARAKRGDVVAGDWRSQPLPPPQANMPAATTAPARPAGRVAAQLGFDPDTAQLPPEAEAYRDAPPARWSAARLVFGGAAMWWTLAIPLWGLGALVAGLRAGRPGRGVAHLLAALAVTLTLVLAGGWWYGGRG